MANLLGVNWLTTVLGVAGAVAQVLLPLFERGEVTSDEILRAVITAILGWAAKSFNVTGTGKTAKNTSEVPPKVPPKVSPNSFS